MRRLDTRDPRFEAAFADLRSAKRAAETDVEADVARLIARVRAEGDAALRDLTARFDGHALPLRVPEAEIDAAVAAVDAGTRAALDLAAERIAAYHDRQRPPDAWWQDDTGAWLGWRFSPVDAAGIYVPGGRAAYPSSVLMNAIPARAAGVGRIAMCVPTPGGEVVPAVLAAARIAGVSEIWRIGGAQAVAALAHGTESVAPVDVVTGPGNAWVATAKRQVYGQVGIDMVAGPSEVLILADGTADPDWLALDLLAQAEHDPSAQSILITTDAALADAAAAAVEARLADLARADIARASWEAHGAVILARDSAEMAALSDRIAPEHLEIQTADADDLAGRVRHAGAVFIGPWTPEAVGDYVGGPNHVLPTAGAARFASGLSVFDFLKRTTLAKMSPGALSAIGPAAEALAAAEGLEAHGLSVAARRAKLNA